MNLKMTSTQKLCKCHSIPLDLCAKYGSDLVTKLCSGCLKNKCEQEFEPEQTNLGGFVWNENKCHKCNTDDQFDLILKLSGGGYR